MTPTTLEAGRRLPQVLALTTVLLSGCAGFSADGGAGDVQRLAEPGLGLSADAGRAALPVAWAAAAPAAPATDGSDADRSAVEDATRRLLAQPLGADDAVRLALMHNAGLQAAFAGLRAAEAERVAGGRLANPGFAFGRSVEGDRREIERAVVFDVIGLFTLPVRSRIADTRFEQARLDLANRVLALAARTRRAYFEAVAARQLAEYAGQVRTLAQSRAELAQRMRAAGNWSRLDQLREQLLYAEATARHARALDDADAARERLTRLLGLWADDADYQLPDRLPDLPARIGDQRDIERRALRDRLDVRMARRNVDGTARALGLTRATRFVNVLDAGFGHTTRNGGEPDKNAWSVGFELPIFDFGRIGAARAQAQYDRAFAEAAEVAIAARSAAREAYRHYRSGYDLARHYRDEIVPLHARVNEESLLRYNGMLIGVWDLLTEARMHADAVAAAIAAQRDFWIAAAQLRYELGGSPEAPADAEAAR
ncbi:TolC family protein [Pigmentiphaga soli]|uniref:TolC family protein n=1 Tax=Pigmentiphaga soli TaxID=1007095 RepID=A0ABP8HNA8_9BURK